MRSLAKLVALALFAGLVAAAPAQAAQTVTIRGGGWGHGIGMSQYGAYGRAQNGRSAEEILEHYYSNANVGSVNARSVRVGLSQGRHGIGVTSSAFRSGGGDVAWKVQGSDRNLATGGPGAEWLVEPTGTGGMRLFKNGDRIKRSGRSVFGSPSKPLLLKYQKQGSLIDVEGKTANYAYGVMEFGSYQSTGCPPGYCLRLVVKLTMQKYLYGLGEVPSSWPGAALRAQAMAGRTYAWEKITRLGQHRSPCDCAVYDSVVDQAYIGDAKRTGSGDYWDDWKAAVDDTNDKVVLFQGSPIQALYSSSSGGHTEHNENVWGGSPLPYLRGVSDGPDDVAANPNHTWSLQMSYAEFENKLNNAYGIGQLKSFELVKPFGVSGRVTVVNSATNTGGVRMVGSNKTARASGWDFRSKLGLKDTLFRVEINYEVGQRFLPRYRSLDRAPGDPTSQPYDVPKGAKNDLGKAQDFERGRMTWTRSADRTVWQWGAVLRKYNKMGRERSGLGMPISDVWGPGWHLGARFVRGMIVWSRNYGAIPIVRGFSDTYRAQDGPKGKLGVPRGPRGKHAQLPNGGRRQRFVDGTLYRNPFSDKVLALWGPLDKRYREMGQATSACGYPTASASTKDGITQATFQHGTMTHSPEGLTVNCPGL